MNIPYEYYRYLVQSLRGPFQINTSYDANGDEIYSGVAENRAQVTDPIWAIGKAVYTPTTVNGSTVNLLTHWSFLTGQDANGVAVTWANAIAGNLTFP
jgi:hypothetical protein